MKTLQVMHRSGITQSFRLSEFFVLDEFFRTGQDNPRRVYQFSEKLWDEFCVLPETVRSVYFEKLVELAVKLDEVRRYYKKPITITSGWRSQRLNRLIQGASQSYHLLGMAADIDVHGVGCKKVQNDWDKRWNGGLGYGKTFTHLDIRQDRERFNY